MLGLYHTPLILAYALALALSIPSAALRPRVISPLPFHFTSALTFSLASATSLILSIPLASTFLDLELLVLPVDRSQGLAYYPGKVTATLLAVVHKRITDELGDLRPKLEEALAAAPPPLGVHVVVLDLLVKLGRLGRMDTTLGGDTAASPAGLAAGLSVLHCDLSLGVRQDIRTAAPDSGVAG